MLDWPADVVELTKGLLIDRFAVLGISGGGPYAAACSSAISGRLTRVGIVCGKGRSEALGMKDGVSWTLPGTRAIMRVPIRVLASMGLRKDPDQFVLKSRETLSELDSHFRAGCRKL